MATRERPSDLGARDAARFAAETAEQLRVARMELGVSQATVARRAGMSQSQLSRLERGDIELPTLEQLCRASRAVGLEPRFTTYRGETRVRDRASLAILDRLEAMLGAPLRMMREVALPIPGDQRAWDARITDGRSSASAECESRLRDLQALLRRIALKQRDDPRAGAVLLVLNRTRHNRDVLREHREALRAQFPLDGAEVARLLRGGVVSAVGGVILV